MCFISWVGTWCHACLLAMAYITKTSQLQDLQSINVFLQVRDIKMFQLVTRFEYVSKDECWYLFNDVHKQKRMQFYIPYFSLFGIRVWKSSCTCQIESQNWCFCLGFTFDVCLDCPFTSMLFVCLLGWCVCIRNVFSVQTNLVLQQKHNRHTHSANLDAAMTSGGSKQQETEFRTAGNTRKCCICNLSSHFFWLTFTLL